jgi:hypothetical protein
MLLILPLLNFVFLFLWSLKYYYKEETPLRLAFLNAAIFWGFLIIISTETLSLFHGITLKGIAGFWILAFCVTLLLYIITPPRHSVLFQLRTEPFLLSEKILLLSVGIILILTGVIAFQSLPNNWDSMTYHMSRVMHWIQNRSVSHYPSHNIRQITHMPFPEYIILHLQILTNTDRAANMVQWFAMLASLCATTLAARQLGSNRWGQILTVIFIATYPMGILQSTRDRKSVV